MSQTTSSAAGTNFPETQEPVQVGNELVQNYENNDETGAGTKIQHYSQKAVRWMITSWKPKADIERTLRENEKDIKICVFGEEKAPTTGRTHVHIAIIFKNRMTVQNLKYFFNDHTIHAEVMRGKWQDAVKYVCKEDHHVVQIGDGRGPDKNGTDREEFFTSIIQNPTLDHLKETLQEQPKFSIHTNVALKLISLFGSTGVPKDTMNVSYFYGISGSGKSTTAHRLLQGQNYSSCSFTDGGFVVGYRMTEVVLFDDINVKSGRFPVEKLLQYLDKWPCSVDVKGSELPWLAKTIFITRCEPPNRLHLYGWKKDDELQLLRRITHLYHCWKDDDGNYQYELERENPDQRKLIMDQLDDIVQNP